MNEWMNEWDISRERGMNKDREKFECMNNQCCVSCIILTLFCVFRVASICSSTSGTQLRSKFNILFLFLISSCLRKLNIIWSCSLSMLFLQSPSNSSIGANNFVIKSITLILLYCCCCTKMNLFFVSFRFVFSFKFASNKE